MSVTAATHKRVFYRVYRGEDSQLEDKCARLANIINECNGRVYGTSPMGDYKVMMSFEIPSIAVSKFLDLEKDG